MRFDVLTLFPDLLRPFAELGVLGRAVQRGLVDLHLHDLRKWSGNRWGQVDDEPYGGGAGMVLQAPPLIAAVREVIGLAEEPARTIVLSPRGRVLDQRLVEELATGPRLLLVCGRYEGFDERIFEVLGCEEVSLGDFVLGGGEVAAAAVIETVSRLVPGVVGDPESVSSDSFTTGLLDSPSYTRPPVVEGRQVPAVLRSGHHDKVRRWRLERSVELTVTRRPDLIIENWSHYGDEVRGLTRRFAPELAADAAARQSPDDGEKP
jgi:tRNA (guanine37-N1)-methyltransferase